MVGVALCLPAWVFSLPSSSEDLLSGFLSDLKRLFFGFATLTNFFSSESSEEVLLLNSSVVFSTSVGSVMSLESASLSDVW